MFYMIIKHWLKIVLCNENKCNKHIYTIMLQNIDIMPEKENWAVLVKRLLGSLGFNEIWLAQGLGNVHIFHNLVKQ